MSQIRKSASFRSRIPVRERFPQRRCSSPQPIVSSKSRKNRKNAKFFLDRYYSSSSFSSSDESNDSDEPLQVKSYFCIWKRWLTEKLWKLTLDSNFCVSRARHPITSWKFHGDMQCEMWSEHKLISFVDACLQKANKIKREMFFFAICSRCWKSRQQRWQWWTRRLHRDRICRRMGWVWTVFWTTSAAAASQPRTARPTPFIEVREVRVLPSPGGEAPI